MKREREAAARQILDALAGQGIPWRGELDAILPIIRHAQLAFGRRVLDRLAHSAIDSGLTVPWSEILSGFKLERLADEDGNEDAALSPAELERVRSAGGQGIMRPVRRAQAGGGRMTPEQRKAIEELILAWDTNVLAFHYATSKQQDDAIWEAFEVLRGLAAPTPFLDEATLLRARERIAAESGPISDWVDPQGFVRAGPDGFVRQAGDVPGPLHPKVADWIESAGGSLNDCPDCGVHPLEFHRDGCPRLPPTGLQVIR